MNEEEAIELLKKYAPNDGVFEIVLAHSRKVEEIALRIALKIADHYHIDIEFLKVAALLHDIGRFKTGVGEKTIFHGVEGGLILREEGHPDLARVAENHEGAGITKHEAVKLGLPEKDYLPETIEEKIITHADSLVRGDKEITFDEMVERWKTEVGDECAERAIKLHKELEDKAI